MSSEKRNAPNNEYQNFKKLAEKLVAVPKKEVDEKKADYERDKNKKERPVK